VFKSWLNWLYGKLLARRWIVHGLTLVSTVLDAPVGVHDFQKGNPRGINGIKIQEGGPLKASKPVVMTAHVFHQNQVEFFVAAINKLPAKSLVLITTPNPQIKDAFETLLDTRRLEVEVRLCQNRGRNFGPLLVEFSTRLLTVESFIHVHSKVSSHSGERDGSEWVARLMGLLLDVDKLRRTRALLDEYPQVGVVYSEVSDLFQGLSFRWGLSKFVLVPLLRRLGGFPKIRFQGAVAFPAGGMFWVKSDAIRPLLEADWSYADFPPELGQLEGTVQHGIERLVGALSSSLGYQHLVYSSHDDVFEIRNGV